MSEWKDRVLAKAREQVARADAGSDDDSDDDQEATGALIEWLDSLGDESDNIEAMRSLVRLLDPD